MIEEISYPYTLVNNLLADADEVQANLDEAKTQANYVISFANDGWVPANETWTYASASTFRISGDKTGKYQAGQKIKLTQTTAKYFIITKVEYSSPNTTITVYGGTDYTIANASITNNFFSLVKCPFGFPMEQDKWIQTSTYTSTTLQATPTQDAWYNLGSFSLAIPIGSWSVEYFCSAATEESSGAIVYYKTTLSTANNSESDSTLTCSYACVVGGGTSITNWSDFHNRKSLSLDTATTYYLNHSSRVAGADNITIYGAVRTAIIRAVCVYL